MVVFAALEVVIGVVFVALEVVIGLVFAAVEVVGIGVVFAAQTAS